MTANAPLTVDYLEYGVDTRAIKVPAADDVLDVTGGFAGSYKPLE